MPVPTVTYINRDFSFPAPQPASPNAEASASFSSATATLNSRAKSCTGLFPCHPGNKSTSPNAPLPGYTTPVEPIPMPEISTPASREVRRSMSIIRPSPFAYPPGASVGDSSLDSTFPLSSTIPTAIFVPPISTAPITISPVESDFPVFAVTGAMLLLLIRRTVFLRQQTVLVFHNEGTITERVAIHSRKPCQLFRSELRGNNVDQKLPAGRHAR